MEGYCYVGQPVFSGDGCMWTKDAVRLREYFRLLWEQHVYWTRMVILGIAFDLPDLEQTTNRLLRNAPDLASVFCHYYGVNGCEFGRLIRNHLVIAAELVRAAKDGNSKAANQAEKRWYANADQIIFFLNHINSYWSIGRMRKLWYEHLALTKEEAVATLTKNYAKSIETFNQIEKEALVMADDFSDGISCQFSL
jgi:hypothetical protein